MELSDQESSGTIKNAEKLKSPQIPQDDHLMENHSISSTEKQFSISSSTVEKIQIRSWKSMGSMNLDEFLKNVWTAVDEVQMSPSDVNPDEKEPASNEQNPFSGKIVAEVWDENQPKNDNLGEDQGDLEQNHHSHDFFNNDKTLVQGDQLQTPDVMTLEHFLIKTGVLKETSPPSDVPMEQAENGKLNDLNSIPQPAGNLTTNGPCLDMNIGIGQLMPTTNPIANGVDNGNNGSTSMYHILSLGSGTTSVEQNVGGEPPLGDMNQNIKRGKRKSGIGSMEEEMAKRYRRMIKNRESALRSRARKQAYTAELELEISGYRTEIERLQLALRIENDFPATKKFKSIQRTMSL